ncbi:two-component system, response regulator YesN [Cohnella sp. OV330]|uniref:response regulator transcription factor n=1 Tax=Cohnella sp. OV330 TaxID=1855288 RepID=UPI0008E1E5BE|nr:response regulator [Cohnella sp. OV330]SFB45287.1 two-component system, response regulator YesN [Cohnella sp. OV330]
MIKVIIVEDEMLVRIGLKNSIEWAKLGMEVIADFSNGQAAWDFYEQVRPDLILTDIRMPNMDGMELISRIRENDGQTKIIILTAYEEFDWVHKAIRFGVTDYILKFKMSIDEMEKVLQKVQAELKTKSFRSPSEPQHDQLNAINLKENAMKDYLSYGRYSDAEFAAITKELRFRLQPERLLLCVMAIDNFKQMESKFKDSHGNLIRFSILNMMSELLAGYNRGEVIYERDEKYILTFSFQDVVSESNIYQQLQDILSHISSVIKTYLNASVTFGISSINNGYSALKPMYAECLRMLDLRFVLGNVSYIRSDVMGAERISKNVAMKLDKTIREWEPFNDRYFKEIEAGIQSLGQLERISKQDIQVMMIRWIHWPTVNLNSYADDISGMALDYAGRIHQSLTLDENIAIFTRYLHEVQHFHEKKRAISKEIAEAIKYIQAHYDQDLSLQQLADQVKMNPSYLSRLFKKHLQTSFIEYLNAYRIDMAKNLLMNTHLKSYEIAAKTGYKDDSYFSRIFKRVTGMRPHEFRKQWFVDNREEKEDDADDEIVQ